MRELLPNLTDEQGRTIGDAKEASFRERASELEPLPGLVDFVERGRKQGCGSPSSPTPPRTVEAILPALKLRGLFYVVVLADEVEAVKPDPAPYRAALKRTGVPAERALAFEDSVWGISSSVAAGIPIAGIASSEYQRDSEEGGVDDAGDPDRPAAPHPDRRAGVRVVRTREVREPPSLRELCWRSAAART